MKKGIKLLLLFILISFSKTYAQKERILDSITAKMCDDIKKVDIDKASPDSLSMMFEKMMMDACTPFLGELMQYYDLAGPGSTEAGTKLGEEVAKKLFANCPKAMSYAMKMAEAKDDPPPVDLESSKSNFKGKLSKVVKGDFYKFICTDEKGLQETFYWFQNCGAEKLLPDPSKYIGKTLKINFVEVNYFIPSENNYKKIKMMAMLEVIN